MATASDLRLVPDLALRQPETGSTPQPTPPPQVGGVDPRVLAFISSRLNMPAGLDGEGLQAAQAADMQRERDFRAAQAGERATAMMQRRPANLEGLTNDSMNVRNWVARRALANEDTDRAMKLAMFGPGLQKATGEAAEATVKPELTRAQAGAVTAGIPGIVATGEKTRAEIPGVVAAGEKTRAEIPGVIAAGQKVRAEIPLVTAQAEAVRAGTEKTKVETGAEKDLNDATSERSRMLVAMGKVIKPDAIKDGMTGADALKFIPGLLQVDAEMARLRASISAENVGDADWQVGDRFSQGINKLPPAAQDVLKKSPGARALLDNSARAEALINKHPDGVLTGNDAGDLHRWVSEMTSQLNGIWGMGILRQGNMPMLEEALADPTHLSSILATKVKRQDFLTQLHQFQTMVKQRMYSEGTGTGALFPKAGGYYEGFKNVSGKDAGSGGPTLAPGHAEHYRSHLQPGERLIVDSEGKNGKALAAGEAVPDGFHEVK